MVAYDRIISNYSYCVGSFEQEEYDHAKVDDGHWHAKHDQALMDHRDNVRREEEVPGKEEYGLPSGPSFGAKTLLKEFLDKIPKEPDWVDLPDSESITLAMERTPTVLLDYPFQRGVYGWIPFEWRMISPGPVTPLGNLGPVWGRPCDGPEGSSKVGSRRIGWSSRLGGGARGSRSVMQEWGKVMSDHVGRSKAQSTLQDTVAPTSTTWSGNLCELAVKYVVTNWQ
jgi:hypothetical protein